jgi:hypothetical protein
MLRDDVYIQDAVGRAETLLTSAPSFSRDEIDGLQIKRTPEILSGCGSMLIHSAERKDSMGRAARTWQLRRCM